jgi:K+-transporting ATPase ATPase B chain
MFVFGGGGILAPFIGIKVIDVIITPLVRILNIG